jgi:hypothetical protein
MQITVKNLGPISKGFISLNEHLVIITGPNNTGKSYLTYLIHGISQHEALSGLLNFRQEILDLISERDFIARAIDEGENINTHDFVADILPDVFRLITANTIKNLPRIFASTSINGDIDIKQGPVVFSETDTYIKYFSSANDVFNIITYNGETSRNLVPSSYKNLKEYIIDSLYLYVSLCIDLTLYSKRELISFQLRELLLIFLLSILPQLKLTLRMN